MSELFTGAQALAWTGGAAAGQLPPGFTAVSTDSRKVNPGELFVALKGEAFDGHAFLSQVAAAGAGAAVVARGTALPSGLPAVFVADTLVALGALAHGYRSLFHPKVIGVTGSVGKTSTKELLAAAVSPLGPVLKTQGNLNNEIGLPQTLFGLRAEHRAAVVEMGMNHAGEIGRLAAMAQPSVGVVVNARGVHLEQLGTIENVARAKAELYDALPADGVAVANADDPLVLGEARRSGRRLLTFGVHPADVQLLSTDARGLRGVRLKCRAGGREWDIALSLLGAHNALNACAALAGAVAAEVDLKAAVGALPLAHPAPHRLEIVGLADGVTLLDDCYNASPTSMRSALDTLRAAAEGRRLGAILGDMLELGPDEQRFHREVGSGCGGLSWLLCVGGRAQWIAKAASAAGVLQVGAVAADDLDGGVRWVRAQLQPGDAMLLKASRGMKLERFAAALGAPTSGVH